MNMNMGRMQLFFSCLMILSLGLLSCGDENTDDDPEGDVMVTRNAAVAQDRAVPTPFNAERLPEIEMTSSSDAEPGAGLQVNPSLLLREKTWFTYNFIREGTTYAQAGLNVIAQGQGTYEIKSTYMVLNEKTKQMEVSLLLSYFLDKNLRYTSYRRMTPLGATGESIITEIDFSAEPFGIKITDMGSGGSEDFHSIKRPEGELWLYSEDEFVDMALILQAVDPAAKSIELKTLDVNGEIIRNVVLEKGEMFKIDISVAEKPITTTKYDAMMEGMVVGSYFVDKNGRLVYGEFMGDVKVELNDPDGMYVY